jgi:hypothetical protein
MKVSRRHRRAERFDADLAVCVLAALDRQLAVLTDIRDTLTAGRPSHPGARWHAAAASVVASRRYAEAVAAALGASASRFSVTDEQDRTTATASATT